ncbi:hypothetical protein SAMN04489806_0740 [Paramicrobacterium humi]|uniref:Uncharacterized protein n=1 Tax=Paramicrobacterium humi TaxID=640635 RepID=A0A1H4JJZ6_9MICO|nr:hypothetical protein [Microbacterium humi]SEB46563.1 hypothetical protein SAMN04489806_0740 [Microbacterium humi]
MADLRRRERESDKRLLSPACVDALAHYGARVDLHADAVCDFSHAGKEWSAQLHDTMVVVYDGQGVPPIGSLRPISAAEQWLVGMIGAATRTERGLPALPAFDARPVPELRRQRDKWFSLGSATVTVNLADGLPVEVFRFVSGRSLPEIRAAIGQ